MTVIRRRTQFLLAKARQRKHTVEGLLLAHADIDEVIRVIRSSSTQAEAKERLMQIECPSAMLRAGPGRARASPSSRTSAGAQRDLHADRRPVRRHFPHDARPVGQPGTGKAGGRAPNLLADITEYLRILSDDKNILRIIREDLVSETQTCRPAADRNQRRRNRRVRPGGPDRRRDDGRLHQQQRLHQAHAA